MIQQMLAIWSLVPLPFLNPTCTSGISQFTYCWSLAWRIFSVIFLECAATAAKSLQSCPTLCGPTDGSPSGSPVPGILAISFSNAWKWKVKGESLSRVRLFATPWTAAYQTLLSMGFSRQEHWSGVPSPSPSYSVRWVQVCISLSIPWHCLSLGLEWKWTFSSPVAATDILNAEHYKHHLLDFSVA